MHLTRVDVAIATMRSRTRAIVRSDAVRVALDMGELLLWFLLLPPRAIGLLFRVAAAVGRGIVRWTINLAFALFGLAFVGMVGFGLIRAIFHPLFR